VNELVQNIELVNVFPQFGQRKAMSGIINAKNRTAHPKKKYCPGTLGKTLTSIAIPGR
jgi:hypothetical protein